MFLRLSIQSIEPYIQYMKIKQNKINREIKYTDPFQNILLMNKHKLISLKQIVSNMKQQLDCLKQDQNTHTTHKHSIFQQERRTPKERSVISGSSPHKLTEKSMNYQNKWKERQEKSKNSLQKLNKLTNSIDSQYYSRLNRRKTPPKSKELEKCIERIDKNYYQSVHEWIGQKQNIVHKKPSPQIKTNRQTHQRKFKIFNDIKHSPKASQTDRVQKQQFKYGFNRLLIQCPLSNPHLKFYGRNGIVSKGKRSVSKGHNRSLIFSGSSILQVSSSCSKRHFSKYFTDHYNSCLS